MTNEKGETFFVGKDVAKALGYTNTRDALRKHVDEEDKTTVAICDTGSYYKSNEVVINESGLSALAAINTAEVRLLLYIRCRGGKGGRKC